MRIFLEKLATIILACAFLGACAGAPEMKESAVCNSAKGMFTKNTDGVVTDPAIGLQWIAGPDKDMHRSEALSWVEGVALDGGGWRLPRIEELRTLYRNCGIENGVPKLFQLSGSWIWAVDEQAVERDGYRIALAFDSGAELFLRDTSSFNLRAIAVRGDQAVVEKPVDVSRIKVDDHSYISTRNPAIIIRMSKKYRLLTRDDKMGRFVFNRQGRSTYVAVQDGELSDDRLSHDPGKDVESWTTALSRQQIVDAGHWLVDGVKGFYVDRLKTNAQGNRCALTRDLELYGQGNALVRITLFTAPDKRECMSWPKCAALSETQRQMLKESIDRFFKEIRFTPYAAE